MDDTATQQEKITALEDSIARVIKGKRETIQLAIVALLAEGHLLIEDVPGVGKTTLGQSLARAVGCTFHRIQFTSDLLPSDVIGVSVFNPDVREFEFKRGPVFANIVLADEINRTTPKTQSALLEAMNEDQVTVDNVTHALPRPFMVLATQNPVEHHGTYPLPESQLDRFLMRIEMGYPDPAAEREILKLFANGNSHFSVKAVACPEDILRLQDDARKVRVDDAIADYMIRLSNQTRNHPEIELGISPRGTAALFRASQARALVDGRSFAVPDDVKQLVVPVFGHRVILTRAGSRTRGSALGVLEEILEQLPVPA